MRRAPALLAAVLAAAAGGCAADFLPASYLNDLRVLAIVADPLEVGPGQPVTLRADTWVPPGSAIASRRWTFCPVSAGSVAGYACAVPQCEVDLTAAADGSVTADPSALALQCAGSAGGAPPASGLPEVVQTVFRYRVKTTGGAERDAVLQIPLWTRGPPVDPNLAPVIDQVLIGGQVVYPAASPPAEPPALPAAGEVEVRVVVDPASAQTYLDAAGVERVETITVSFFSTAGRFQDDRTTGIDTALALDGTDLATTDLAAEVYVVVRDLRGGQALGGPFRVPISR